MTLRFPTLREVLVLAGASLLGVGLLASFAPTVLPVGVVQTAQDLETAVPPWMVLVVLSLLVFGYALYRFNRSGPEPVERLVRTTPETDVPDLADEPVSFDPERPGRQFDHAMARTIRRLERNPNAATFQSAGIRHDLRATVLSVRTGNERARTMDDESIDVHGDEAGERAGENDDSDGETGVMGRAAVDATIEDGSWTDDPVAANFLGGPAAPDVSLWRRLYAWFYPARAFERRVERVVDEIERQSAVAVEDASTGVAATSRSPDIDGDRLDGDRTDSHRADSGPTDSHRTDSGPTDSHRTDSGPTDSHRADGDNGSEVGER